MDIVFEPAGQVQNENRKILLISLMGKLNLFSNFRSSAGGSTRRPTFARPDDVTILQPNQPIESRQSPPHHKLWPKSWVHRHVQQLHRESTQRIFPFDESLGKGGGRLDLFQTTTTRTPCLLLQPLVYTVARQNYRDPRKTSRRSKTVWVRRHPHWPRKHCPRKIGTDRSVGRHRAASRSGGQ